MGSYNEGKDKAVAWLCANFSKGSTCLDVGACDGKWSKLLNDYFYMDAVEVWEPYIKKNKLADKYAHVYFIDIRDFKFARYDIIIFGDILEHLPVADAQKVIEYAWPRCKQMLIAVPFLYAQGEKNGNPHEVHQQPDLTPELFDARYPGFLPIYMSEDYAYYIKDLRNL